MDFGRKSTDTAEESTKSVQKNMENSGENTDVVQEKISDEECEEQDENSSSGQKWRFLKKQRMNRARVWITDNCVVHEQEKNFVETMTEVIKRWK